MLFLPVFPAQIIKITYKMTNEPTIFDYIIVTAPSEDIAKVYEHQLGLLQLELMLLRECRIFCVPDLQGKRMGSGGGTIHAIQEIMKQYGILDLSSKRTLVVHSGGDSRRAPLCSVIGKAWLNMNILIDEAQVATPLLLLIKELSSSLKTLKVGSLVVSCSDVLLKLQPNLALENDGVYVVSVPASVSIAVNHGVLVCNSFVSSKKEETIIPICGLVDNYLQKPSLSELEKYSATFIQTDCQHYSWIDTGVVIFIGTALSSLISLGEISLTERFELYTELLLACNTLSYSASYTDYLDRCGLNVNSCGTSKLRLLESLWVSFSNHNLYGIVIPEGSFTHLGTSDEIYNFFLFEGGFNLCRSVKSINNVLQTQSATVGSFTKMEFPLPIFSEYSVICEPPFVFSHFCQSELKGSKFVASHLYPSIGSELPITSNFMVQQAFCRYRDDCVSVMVILHFSDDIKISISEPTATIWGMCWKKFFEVIHFVYIWIFSNKFLYR